MENQLLFRVDADGDGDIDEDELQKWIKVQIMDYVQRDAQQVLIQLSSLEYIIIFKSSFDVSFASFSIVSHSAKGWTVFSKIN